MDVAIFYAEPHIGLRFQEKNPLHPRGHSGVDTNGWRLRTPIPSLCKGIVVRRIADGAPGNKNDLGNYVTIRAEGRPERFTYCHLDSLEGVPLVGDYVAFGGYVGPLGTSGYSTGPHCHHMVSLTSDNPNTRAGIVDPYPYIVGARTATAGGGTEPFPPVVPKRKDNDMSTLYHVNVKAESIAQLSPAILAEASAQGLTIVPGALFALCGDAPVPLFTQYGPLANNLAAVHGGALQASIELSVDTFNVWVGRYLRPTTVGGGASAADTARATKALLDPQLEGIAVAVAGVPDAVVLEQVKRLGNG